MASSFPPGGRPRRLALEPRAKPAAFSADRGDPFDLWASNRRIELVQELLAGMPDSSEPKGRRAVNDPLESLRSIRRQTEAEIRSSAAADSLWVK